MIPLLGVTFALVLHLVQAKDCRLWVINTTPLNTIYSVTYLLAHTDTYNTVDDFLLICSL